MTSRVSPRGLAGFLRNSLQVFFIREEAYRLGKNVPELPAETNLFGSKLPFPDEFRVEEMPHQGLVATSLNQATLSDNEEPYQGSVEERLEFEMDGQCSNFGSGMAQ
jgi:hypothetical protein